MNDRRSIYAAAFSALSGFLWRYALIYFMMLAAAGEHFPFFYALVFYTAAYAISRLSRGRGYRWIIVIFIQLMTFLLLYAVFIHDFFGVSASFSDLNWPGQFLSIERSITQWFFLFLDTASALFLWISGISASVKKTDYQRSCGILDAGIAVFFIIFLLKMVLRTRAGIVITDLKLIRLFYAFFIFSLASVILSREFSDTRKSFMNTHRGTGAVLLGAAAVLACVSAVFLILLPELNTAARSGYMVLEKASVPAKNILAHVLRFLFFRKSSRTDAAASGGGNNSGDELVSAAGVGEDSILGTVIMWILGILAASAVVITAAVFLWAAVKKLLTRTVRTENVKSELLIKKFIRFIFKAASVLIKYFKLILIKKKQTERTAENVYMQFLRWGSRGGVARLSNETPYEYQKRLSGIYKFGDGEMELITATFTERLYGERPPQTAADEKVISAFKNLKRLGNFPERLKVWLKR